MRLSRRNSTPSPPPLNPRSIPAQTQPQVNRYMGAIKHIHLLKPSVLIPQMGTNLETGEAVGTVPDSFWQGVVRRLKITGGLGEERICMGWGMGRGRGWGEGSTATPCARASWLCGWSVSTCCLSLPLASRKFVRPTKQPSRRPPPPTPTTPTRPPTADQQREEVVAMHRVWSAQNERVLAERAELQTRLAAAQAQVQEPIAELKT